MRNELLQERASRQDLECDKMALERQVHTLLSGGKQLHTVLHCKLSSKHQLIKFIHVFSPFSFDCIHLHITVMSLFYDYSLQQIPLVQFSSSQCLTLSRIKT